MYVPEPAANCLVWDARKYRPCCRCLVEWAIWEQVLAVNSRQGAFLA